MNDEYLWDGTGEPDPEVRRLEQVLCRFRHNRPAPQFPEPVRLVDRLRGLARLGGLVHARVFTAPLRLEAAVAAAVLLGCGIWWALRTAKLSPPVERVAKGEASRAPTPGGPSWEVARIEGAPRVGPTRIVAFGRLAPGEWLETDKTSRVRIEVDGVGRVEVEPNTRLRLIETRADRNRLELLRGTIHATISAPPRQFFVETPSAVAVDLGCAYTLTVDDRGAGLVRVTTGWVGFEFQGRESFVPAGALCATRPGVGPGTPYFKDTSKAFRAALITLDFETVSPERRTSALNLVITQARKRDAVTLWHLLSRVTEQERSRVYDRLATLAPPPVGVTRDGITRLDQKMLDAWWDQLGLGKSWWWRMWERSWPPRAK